MSSLRQSTKEHFSFKNTAFPIYTERKANRDKCKGGQFVYLLKCQKCLCPPSFGEVSVVPFVHSAGEEIICISTCISKRSWKPFSLRPLSELSCPCKDGRCLLSGHFCFAALHSHLGVNFIIIIHLNLFNLCWLSPSSSLTSSSSYNHFLDDWRVKSFTLQQMGASFRLRLWLRGNWPLKSFAFPAYWLFMGFKLFKLCRLDHRRPVDVQRRPRSRLGWSKATIIDFHHLCLHFIISDQLSSLWSYFIQWMNRERQGQG